MIINVKQGAGNWEKVTHELAGQSMYHTAYSLSFSFIVNANHQNVFDFLCFAEMRCCFIQLACN